MFKWLNWLKWLFGFSFEKKSRDGVGGAWSSYLCAMDDMVVAADRAGSEDDTCQ